MFDAPPAWFRDEVHTLISRGDIPPEEGLLAMIHPPDWAFGDKPTGAGTLPIVPPETEFKVCSDCYQELAPESFYVKPDGQVHPICRPCEAKRQRKRRAAWSAERTAAERVRDARRKRRVRAAA